MRAPNASKVELYAGREPIKNSTPTISFHHTPDSPPPYTHTKMISEGDVRFARIAGVALCASAFLVMLILTASSYAVRGVSAEIVRLPGGSARGIVDMRQHARRGFSTDEVHAMTALVRSDNQWDMYFHVLVASDLTDANEVFSLRQAIDITGYGVVLIGEMYVDRVRRLPAGTSGTIYIAASTATNATYVQMRHSTGGVQRMHAWAGFTIGVSGVRDPLRLPDEADPVERIDVASSDERRVVCDPSTYTDGATGRTILRVGVLHTPEVLAQGYYGGSSDAVRAEVAVAVATANAEAFPRSGINMQIELCANDPLPMGTPSLERTSPSATLVAFSQSRAVETVRVNNKCDTMVLFATLPALGNRACGIGYLPGAYAVVADVCFVDNYSFLHETGHNLGACHGAPAHTCSTGGNGYGDDEHRFRTILAYSSICLSRKCVRVPRFSNVNTSFSWEGYAIGSAGQDNAHILNTNKASAAGRVC